MHKHFLVFIVLVVFVSPLVLWLAIMAYSFFVIGYVSRRLGDEQEALGQLTMAEKENVFKAALGFRSGAFFFIKAACLAIAIGFLHFNFFAEEGVSYISSYRSVFYGLYFSHIFVFSHFASHIVAFKSPYFFSKEIDLEYKRLSQ